MTMARKQSNKNPGDLVTQPLSDLEKEERRKEAQKDGLAPKLNLSARIKPVTKEAKPSLADEIAAQVISEEMQDNHFQTDRAKLFKLIEDSCADHAAAAHQAGNRAISQAFKMLADVARNTEKRSSGVKYWRKP